MIRFLDIILSAGALICLSPLLLPVILILKVTGEGEVFFYQERVGKSLVKFKLLKFATMLKDSPNIGTGSITVNNDPRVLPFGKFLRKSKINEIPQLINILIGDMSLIGPRPVTYDAFCLYEKEVQEQISLVRPGLSGIGSIIFRDEENFLDDKLNPRLYYKEVIAPFKGEVECWYVHNQSIRLYLKAIILTLFVLLFPNSKFIWKTFPTLPNIPDNLKENFRDL